VRHALLLVGAILVATAVVRTARAQPPNILIFVTDDQRATETLGVMPKTRRLFGAGGVRYPNAFATTPLCCPSRSTIFTGRYAHNTGVHKNFVPKSFDTTTMFTRLLRENGYRTALVGKFLNGWPHDKAPPYFDKWAVGGAYVDPIFNVNGSFVSRRGYVTTLTKGYSLRFLRGFETHDSAPWLLYVATRAPHYPWPAESRFADAPVAPWSGNPAVFERDRSDKPAYVRGFDYSISGGRRVREAQLRTLMSVDDMVGTIFSTLGALGERKNTLAFFLSDNGYTWTEHHLGGDRGTAGQKGLPYTASVTLPFLVRWPGVLPAGTRDRRLAGTVDIAPTILEAAGIPPDPTKPPLDGRSLLEPSVRTRMLLEYWHERDRGIPTWTSTRTRDYQYIETYGSDGTTIVFREYYDLRDDPWQLRNLLRDGDPSNNPDIAALSAQLAQDHVCAGVGSGPTPCP
jgi:arylsulfatase A-like enzyme